MKFMKTLWVDEKGSIAAETAVVMSLIAYIGIGVIDFGLAYSRNLQLANAARAGMQYAMVRKPVDEDYTAIVNAVETAAPVAENASRVITATRYCECPDGSLSDCTGEDGENLSCDDGSLRAAYLDISITEDYNMLFPYPGFDSTITLSESVSLRMN